MIQTAAEMLLLGDYIEGNNHYRMEYKSFLRQRGIEDDGALMTPAGESE